LQGVRKASSFSQLKNTEIFKRYILMDKRKDMRLSMKLYSKLRAVSGVSWGLLTDVSENGIFIKSNRDFTMGEAIDIELFMPDNTNALLKGVIRRKIELPDSHRKYGLGIELKEKDMVYRRFLRNLRGKTNMHLEMSKGIGDEQVVV
jgi:Tfp pilus assembly protein PilZ